MDKITEMVVFSLQLKKVVATSKGFFALASEQCFGLANDWRVPCFYFFAPSPLYIGATMPIYTHGYSHSYFVLLLWNVSSF